VEIAAQGRLDVGVVGVRRGARREVARHASRFPRRTGGANPQLTGV
jgi:hypothetical protein